MSKEPAEVQWLVFNSDAKACISLISRCLAQKSRKYSYNSFKINGLQGLSLVIEKQQVFAAMHPTSGTIFKVSNLDLREKGSREEL